MRKAILAIIAAAMLTPAASFARGDSRPNLWVDFGELISSGTTLAASRTATIASNKMQGVGLLMLYVSVYDADDSETGVSVACTSERVSGGASYRVPTCPWDSNNLRYNCEAGPMFWNPSDETATDIKRQLFRVDVEGMRNTTCTFTFTGGSAADWIMVKAEGAVK